MHSTDFYEYGITAHHRGDYSGNIKFTLPSSGVDSVEIPFKVIKMLVLSYYSRTIIYKLECADSDEELERILFGMSFKD